MTTHSISAPRFASNRRGTLGQRLWTAAVAMLQARQTRRLLAEMDSHLLADIGISRADAAMEANRPFWDVR